MYATLHVCAYTMSRTGHCTAEMNVDATEPGILNRDEQDGALHGRDERGRHRARHSQQGGLEHSSMSKHTINFMVHVKCTDNSAHKQCLSLTQVHVLMRDEKEGRKKQAKSNKQQRNATQHTQGSQFS